VPKANGLLFVDFEQAERYNDGRRESFGAVRTAEFTGAERLWNDIEDVIEIAGARALQWSAAILTSIPSEPLQPSAQEVHGCDFARAYYYL
jgi:hypothetical protein